MKDYEMDARLVKLWQEYLKHIDQQFRVKYYREFPTLEGFMHWLEYKWLKDKEPKNG